jgi:hypothetical protein
VENKVATVGESEIITSLVINGDLSKLSPQQQVQYYHMFCNSLGLNPLTKPFDICVMKEKKVLYANKNCAEQLRRNNGVSFLDLKQEVINDLCVTTVKGQDKSGRLDVDTGAVNIKGLVGNDLANAMMKSATKAKRRLTLSLCSIGVLDETELETIPDAQTQEINITGSTTATKVEPKQAQHSEIKQSTPVANGKTSKLSEDAHSQIIDMGMEMIEAKYNGWTEKRLTLKVKKAEMLGGDSVLNEIKAEHDLFKASAENKLPPKQDEVAM